MQDQVTKRSFSTTFKAVLSFFYSSIRLILPISFFISGFIWDAMTIGHRVAWSDLAIFLAYIVAAAFILHQLATPAFWWQHFPRVLEKWGWLKRALSSWPMEDWPYWILQFLFGSLLSALFILYFKSSSYGFAWGLTLFLGILLIANEFLEGNYRRFTLCWSMYGLCSILFLNFALPYVLGSVNALWFYLSTCLGAMTCHTLYYHAPRHSGSIWPVWLIAVVLMVGYRVDMIPPVPLVKEAIVIAYDIEKTPEGYWMTLEKAPWWKFWRVDSDHFYVDSGQRLVCFSSIFAPQGLRTRLIHDWQKKVAGNWVSVSSPGFALSGGRDGGYRGYTYKSNPAPGEWRVLVQTETHQTIAVSKFTVSLQNTFRQKSLVKVRY